tara:strand:+ start:17 stop:841 length:825 start_codon:yes stop_codon:yes gene_type:complete
MLNSLKKIVVTVFRYFHSIFKLDELNNFERLGGLSSSSKLKFIRKANLILPFERGLTMRGVSFNNYILDPFGSCLENQNNNFDKKKFKNDLYEFYKAEKGKTIRNYNNIFSGEFYENYPIWSFSFPWENLSINEKLDIYPGLVIENRSEFLNNTLTDSDNLYDSVFSESHAIQFEKLINNLKDNGFNQNLARPKVIILIKNKKWKWIMSGQGNHRAYCMKFLGYENLPVQIEAVININELGKLNRKGKMSYSYKNAQDLFNLVYSGDNVSRGIV